MVVLYFPVMATGVCKSYVGLLDADHVNYVHNTVAARAGADGSAPSGGLPASSLDPTAEFRETEERFTSPLCIAEPIR